METSKHGLLITKIQPPPLRPGLVDRGALVEVLRSSSARLTSVIAPAGWGKSTLLTAWAHDPGEERAVAWLQVDPEDGNPTRFWEYVLAALEVHLGDAVTEARNWLAAPGLSPTEGAIPALLNACAERDRGLVLILDDVHHIAGTEALETLEFAISHLPHTLNLTLASRSDPALPLARLRARGELTELRGTDLAMSTGEVAEVLTEVGRVEVEPEDASLVSKRTEGWPAGVYLVGLALRGHVDYRSRLAAFAGDHRHIADYFAFEVLSDLDVDTRRFLLELSVLERFTAPLVDSVWGKQDSRHRLDELDRANLFVVRLDAAGEWYRFHHLFRDLLRHELQLEASDSETALLRRAAVWFEEHGDPDSAISHYLDADDVAGACQVVVRHAVGLLDEGRAQTVLRWLDLIPDGAYENEPRLSMLAAWLLCLARDFTPVPHLLRLLERVELDETMIPGGFSSRPAIIGFLDGAARGFGPEHDLDGAIDAGLRAAQAEPSPVGVGFILARSLLGSALIHSGRPDEALVPLEEAFRRGREVPEGRFTWVGVAGIFAIALLLTGDLGRARGVLAEVLARVGTPGGRHPERVFAVVGSGRLSFLDGDFERSADQLGEGVELARFWGQQEIIILASAWLAEAELRRGDMNASRKAIGEAFDLIEADGGLPLPVQVAEETAARLRLVTRRRTTRHGPLVEELTDRELQVLQLLPTGASMARIADRLYLSVNTVKGYAKSLYRKLGVSSRQQAVEVAVDLNLIQPPG